MAFEWIGVSYPCCYGNGVLGCEVYKCVVYVCRFNMVVFWFLSMLLANMASFPFTALINFFMNLVKSFSMTGGMAVVVLFITWIFSTVASHTKVCVRWMAMFLGSMPFTFYMG